MARRYYSSTAVRTTLTADITAASSTITVAAATGFPASYPWTGILSQDTLNEEVVEVTARSGTTLTVTRGVDGTTATSHSAGATFNHGVSARDFDEPNAFVNNGGLIVPASTSTVGLTVKANASQTANLAEFRNSANAVKTSIAASGALVSTDIFADQVYAADVSLGGPTYTSVTGSLALKAPLASPALTGTPTAPTAAAGTNTTQIATTAFVTDGLAAKASTANPALTGQASITGTVPGYMMVESDASNSQGQVYQNGSILTLQADANNVSSNSAISMLIDGTERLNIASGGLITGSGTSLGAWTAYTPTVTAESGTPTTTSATSAYAQLGKIVTMAFEVTITNKGTASDGVQLSLPVTQKSGFRAMGVCRDRAVAGTFGYAELSGGKITLKAYNLGTYWVNNYIILGSVTYEAA